MKRQPTEWEKISANDTTNKGLIFSVYKQLIQLNTHTYAHILTNLIKTKKKNGQNTEQTFFQRPHVDNQQAYEKLLNVVNHHGNANQNHNEISFHTCQNGYHQKEHKE